MKLTKMKINTKSSNNLRSKPVIIALAVIALGLILLGVWLYTTGGDNESTTDYSPATKEDKEFNDAHKAELGTKPSEQAPTDTTPTSSETKKQVTPTITAYGQPAGPGNEFKLNGFVSGIIESDGVCTLTLTKSEAVVTVSKGALQNAQDTSCGQSIVPFEKLSTGTWQAVLSYESPKSAGSSVITQVEIK